MAWSETPYGGLALFILVFAESSCFPIPSDALVIALCVGKPKVAFRFAAICSIASVLGGIAGYAIGLFAYGTLDEPLLNLYDSQRHVFDKVQNLYSDSCGF